VKRLLLDARWLSTGIGAYTLNLVKELHGNSDIRLRAITLPRHEAILKLYCDQVGLVDASMYSLKEQFDVARAARESDVLHVPHYNAPLLYRGELLVTILDLTHILDDTYKHTVKSRIYARPMLTMVSKKAAHIFTLSEYSKRAIVEHLQVAENKVTVTYCGVGPQFFPEPRERAQQIVQRVCDITKPYILFVGNLKPHKNVDGLLHAFALISWRAGRDFELLIIGEDVVGGPALRELATKLGIGESTRFVGSVSDEVLRCAYSAAELTVLPSFEEGFGLPVLESMACGTPVACSRAASLPEVAADAAEYFDPRSIESIAGAMERLLESEDERKRLQQLGLANARRFTWKGCADRHLEVYLPHCA
jgi:glycosyltransferase involved in cell wall biosynthesis